MKMNMNDWRNKILSSKKRYSLPILASLGFDFIGKSIKEGVTNGEIQSKVITAITDKYKFAGA